MSDGNRLGAAVKSVSEGRTTLAHKSRFAVVLGSFMILGLAVVPASASAIIDFSGPPSGGTLTYAGTTNPLIGTGIGITGVEGIGAPQNGGFHTVTGGTLDFTTGAYTSYSTVTQTYTFGSGGTFTIRGAIPDASIATQNLAYNGYFSNVTLALTNSITGTWRMTFDGFDTKSAQLLSYFGLSSYNLYQFSGTLNVVGTRNATTGAFFGTPVFSTDIQNFPTPVPEPASLLLVGSGLTALGAYIRRRNAKQNAKSTPTHLS